MTKRELTCISCPLGCQISVEMEDGNIVSVKGNTCPRGERYARQEVLDPRRTVTSTVETEYSTHRRLPVKTVPEIPKDAIFPVMEEIRKQCVTPPISIGDIIVHDIAGTAYPRLLRSPQQI